MDVLKRVGSLALLLLASIIAGKVALYLRVPLAWMIGPMLISAAAAIVLDIPEPPKTLRVLGQLVIGGSVGLSLTHDATQRILDSAWPIILSAVVMIAVGCLVGMLQTRLTGADRATTIFACVPGSPVEMANLARSFRGDPAKAAFSQTIRLFCIVLIIPPLMMGATQVNVIGSLGTPDLAMMALLFAVSTASGLLAFGCRLANPFFLGPMIGVGLLASGFRMEFATYHEATFAAAQIFLGMALGAMFRRDFLFAAPRFFIEVLCTTAVLMATGALLAEFWTHAGGLRSATVFLANAPGAITEMSITAKALELDVSLIVAFQIFRVFLTMLCLPIIFRLFLDEKRV